jgi:hypothetical protein
METYTCGQLILGTDKRNPCLEVYLDESEKHLHVYYGFELLEVVPNDRESMRYKLMTAQLYNAGLKVKALEEVLLVNHKTMARWGEAVRSGDPEKLTQVLLGRQSRRKLTSWIEAYIRRHWSEIQARGGRDYSKRTRQEVERVFGVTLSGEALRPLLNELRKGTRSGPVPDAPDAPETETDCQKDADPTPAAEENGAGTAPESSTDEVLELFPELLDPVVPDPGTEIEGEEPVKLEVSPLGISVSEGGKPPTDPTQNGEIACATDGANRGTADSNQPALHQPSGLVGEGGGGTGATRKLSPILAEPTQPQTMHCDHLGVLLFCGVLLELTGALPDEGAMLKQWLACILLGAVNIEQTKYLNWNDLNELIGPVVRSPKTQRRQLTQSAQEATVKALFQLNARRLGTQANTDLYLDPHTKHYTGMQEVLKGWCPGIGHPDKAMHCDFLHTVRGEPLYFEITDNYEDLRERLPGLIKRCRQTLDWPLDKVLTLIVDRAVFGLEAFAKIQADTALHLITWEKGYQADGSWPAEKVSGKMVIERSRNRADDKRIYRFEYIDEGWSRQAGMRRLRVRATNPQGRTVELAILTDDLKRAAVEIIWLMFQRWLQENDFKYQIKHFGLNQIVSYQVVPYEQLVKQLTDRQVESEAHRVLAGQRRGLKREQGHLLVEQERSALHAAARQKRLEQLAELAMTGEAPDLTVEREQERQKLTAAQTRHQTTSQARKAKVADLNGKLAALEVQIAKTEKEVSRLTLLAAQNKVRLDSRNKRLMDVLKVIARNSFYKALAPFKQDYDNYRDDHDHFRQLTRCGGVLEPGTSHVTAHLLPRVNYSKKLRKIVERYLEQVNQSEPKMPDGSERRLIFRLAKRSDFKLTLSRS